MSELNQIVENIRTAFEASDYPQDFLDAYDQMECLASHSNRDVFLVRKKENGEMAVAKCYDRSAFPSPPSPDLLKGVSHPGIPRYLEQYKNERTFCIVREYVEGEPLNEYVRDRQLNTKQIVSIANQLCDILEVLHGHTPPVIHRDIKPENIIVKSDETLTLIDFDISRFYKENAASDTTFFGTKGYASPEQYGFRQTDNRTDIYSFGVLLRWLATASTKDNPNVTINKRLQQIIDRCTAFSPDDRYRNVGQIRQALKKVRDVRIPAAVKALCAAAVMLLVLCCGFAVGRYTEWPTFSSRIVFTEPVIEAAVRVQLGKETGELTEEDLLQVKRVYIFGSDVYSDESIFYRQDAGQHTEGPLKTLDDLRLLPNLEEVNICRQGQVDITAVGELTHLYSVHLKHMLITGVEPIAKITRLKHAVLFDCGLDDVSALQDLQWLETLNVGLNKITDFEHIGTYPRVTSLILQWLNMKDLDGIEQRFPRLQTVSLENGTFEDFSGLRDLPDLKIVYLQASQQDMVKPLLEGRDIQIVPTTN